MNIKVITLNLGGKETIDKTAEPLAKKKPDILLLQEVLSQKPPLMNKFPDYKYRSFAAAYTATRKGGPIQMGNAVVSKFPIINENVVFYDIPFQKDFVEPIGSFENVPRNLQYCEIRVETKTLNVFNTHGIWGVDSEDDERRIKMAKTIAKNTENKKLCILGGDFNITPNTKTIEIIESVLKNISKNEAKSTFNMKVKKDKVFSKLVVDMLFVSEDVKINSVRVSKESISDHLPVIAELEV